MQLPLTDGRAVRMIQALLAAADPLDKIERGGDPSVYEPLAVTVLTALRNGADERRIVLTLSEHALVDQPVHLGMVAGFAQAVLDWWANAETRWNSPVAI